MKTCGYKITKDEYGEKTLTPEIEGVRVKINPNPKNETEFYIILD